MILFKLLKKKNAIHQFSQGYNIKQHKSHTLCVNFIYNLCDILLLLY